MSPYASTLVVLAAGLGTRFGGMKQLAAVGPHGESLMDYSIFDAARAGFGRVVFVIRPEMDRRFRSVAAERYGRMLPFTIVHQRLDDVPAAALAAAAPPRSIPWGTGQAVLATRSVVAEPFAVANADDFYGAAAYRAVAEFLGGVDPDAALFGLVGYRLEDTVSPAGGVNRAVLGVDRHDMLESIDEVVDIRLTRPGVFAGRASGERRMLNPGAQVSMNLWGFTPQVFQFLARRFATFVRDGHGDRREFLLPTAIQDDMASHRVRVRVLESGGRWLGLTHAADVPLVSAALRRLIDDGRYPERLW